jgi:protein-disulfide isomerase
LTGLAALAGLSLLRLVSQAMAVSAAEVTRPQPLPDMALGAADAKVTIVEYAAPTYPHGATFNTDVFPRIKSEFMDLACAMLTRRIAGEDSTNICRRHHVQAAGPAGGENFRYAAADRAAGRPQHAGGRGLPEGPGDAGPDQPARNMPRTS